MRSPTGQFVANDAALQAWLPKLLGWTWRKPLSVMLAAAERWCDLQAAEQLHSAATALEKWGDPTGAQRFAEARQRQVAIWFQCKAILCEARQKLEALES